MPDFRSYAPNAEADAPEIVLSQEESHHLVRVNRARAGDPVIVFNGRGTEWICECTDTSRSAARLQVLSRQQAPPLRYEVTLAQAIPKGKAMDQIVRKATELGTRRIIPLLTERTEVQLGERRSQSKAGKWEMTAIEAAKQCGNSYLPEIRPAGPIADFLASPPAADLLLIASLQHQSHLKRVLDDFEGARGGRSARSLVWLVGPEGDFTEGELHSAEGAGFIPISLGPLVLRCETAVISALSILNHELQYRLMEGA